MSTPSKTTSWSVASTEKLPSLKSVTRVDYGELPKFRKETIFATEKPIPVSWWWCDRCGYYATRAGE